jgi:hypothetical protein
MSHSGGLLSIQLLMNQYVARHTAKAKGGESVATIVNIGAVTTAIHENPRSPSIRRWRPEAAIDRVAYSERSSIYAGTKTLKSDASPPAE